MYLAETWWQVKKAEWIYCWVCLFTWRLWQTDMSRDYLAVRSLQHMWLKVFLSMFTSMRRQCVFVGCFMLVVACAGLPMSAVIDCDWVFVNLCLHFFLLLNWCWVDAVFSPMSDFNMLNFHVSCSSAYCFDCFDWLCYVYCHVWWLVLLNVHSLLLVSDFHAACSHVCLWHNIASVLCFQGLSCVFFGCMVLICFGFPGCGSGGLWFDSRLLHFTAGYVLGLFLGGQPSSWSLLWLHDSWFCFV